MAGLSTPSARPQQAGPKQMSSRLLNMKFMQRAAAASPTSTPTTSKTQTPSTEPYAKRRRIENTASSPSTSTPATPSQEPGTAADTQTSSPTFTRGGISTFNRGDGADTEWVLDIKMEFPGKAQSTRANQTKSQADEVNGSRFSSVQRLQAQDSDDSEEDIWTSQTTGRQTYGSFKQKRKTRTAQTPENGNGDLSSASEQSDAAAESDDSDDDHSHRRTPARKQQKKVAKEVDSDEEMRQVRRAIEQKHRSMQGTSSMGRGGGGDSSRGQKRGREDGNYKMRKKSRKTI